MASGESTRWGRVGQDVSPRGSTGALSVLQWGSTQRLGRGGAPRDEEACESLLQTDRNGPKSLSTDLASEQTKLLCGAWIKQRIRTAEI